MALLHNYPTICPHLREKSLYHVRGAKMKCYCKERKGHWYFRMRVPKELHPYLPSEISYSIKGLDLETARFRCKLPGDRLRSIFEQTERFCIMHRRCALYFESELYFLILRCFEEITATAVESNYLIQQYVLKEIHLQIPIKSKDIMIALLRLS